MKCKLVRLMSLSGGIVSDHFIKMRFLLQGFVITFLPRKTQSNFTDTKNHTWDQSHFIILFYLTPDDFNRQLHEESRGGGAQLDRESNELNILRTEFSEPSEYQTIFTLGFLLRK